MSSDDLATFVKSPFYPQWRAKVESVHGCRQPIKLSGKYQIHAKTSGAVLHDHSGHIMVPCGTRRANLCPPCAARYADDAFHLIRAGLTGDTNKDVSDTVATVPRVFATLTAPSFGAVHSRRVSNRGRVIPCRCGEKHGIDDPRVHGAIDYDTYDYEAAVLWQAHCGLLWHRFTTAVRRKLAVAAGITVREFKQHAMVSYSKVAEYQKRGLVHFHAIVRIDGPTGPGSTPPEWANRDLLEQAIRKAVAAVVVDTHRRTGELLYLRWGNPDVKHITTTTDKPGTASDVSIAGYVAKYSTKDSGVTESGVDRAILSRDHIDRLRISQHHKRMMFMAWDLGGIESYQDLNLRRATHKLGFRGHFLTKSQAYSTTFKKLRAVRQLHRLEQLLTELDTTADDIVVINSWDMTSIGYATEPERELAAAIGDRLEHTRQSRKE